MNLNAKITNTDEFNSYIGLANKLITNPKYGKQFLNPDVFYTKQLLDTIRIDKDQYVYFRYADNAPMSEKANKLQVRRWAPLQAHTVPLTEGIPPISDKGSVEMYEIDTDQYGRYMEFSDKVNFKVVDPILAHYAAEYSIVAVETLDLLARETLFSIANKVYAGYVKNIEALTENSKPTITDLRKIVLGLKKQLVKPRSNGRYHVIAGPDFFFDMVSDPTVEKFMTIDQTTKTMYDDSMLVPMFNMEFYETLVCPTHGEFTKIVSGSPKDAIRLFAVDASGNYEFKTLTADDTLTNGTKVLKTNISGYVKDSRTGEDASYIPNQKIWDIAAYNADTKAGGKTWYEFKMQHVLILGKDALLKTGISGEDSAKMYTKALGSSGVLDPIDQRQSIGFKINDVGFGSARLEAIVDYVCVPSMANLV
jgi:hypothetical protein